MEEKKLIVVESPTKARTIQRFLPSDYKVVSSRGHIRDLPPNEMGIDIENGFMPKYKIIKGKEKIVRELKKAAKETDNILLATDPDREGEAIAWHIQWIIKEKTKRVLFYEITSDAVKKALMHPIDIDSNKVDAQIARRILDRIVGYKVSPLLWKVFNIYTLSAGRVQSVALRLICEREKEIDEFKPEEYWQIFCKFAVNSQTFRAELIKIDGKKSKIRNREDAEKIVSDMKNLSFKVTKFEKGEKKRYPLPPYITSTLQQDGSSKLRLSTKKTMRIAQQLFEGIEIGKEGSVGLITYMRTDSVRSSEKSIRSARDYIIENFGKKYLPGKPVIYKTKKTAQGAHEAIRPTAIKRTPEEIKGFLSNEQFKVYSLVWHRFLASQVVPAVYEKRNIDIEGGKYLLKAGTEILKFPGFLTCYKLEREKKKEIIPEIKPGTILNLIDVKKEQHFTKPPPRYTEGTMVKELEQRGIGRPSTYAPIISTIIDRGYVRKEANKLIPQELGIIVNKVLVSHFSDIFNVKFTKEMEEKLDKIETKSLKKETLLQKFYDPFEKDILKFKSADVKKEIEEPTNEKCELCGSPMVVKWGKYGKFLACSNYPKCKNRRPLKPDKIDEKCPECGAPLVIKRGKYGRFIACSKYPECKYTRALGTGVKCPGCGSEIVERRTKKGKIFYGCAGYPKCKFMLWDKPVARKCEKCGYPILVEKGKWLVCPKCKARYPK